MSLGLPPPLPPSRTWPPLPSTRPTWPICPYCGLADVEPPLERHCGEPTCEAEWEHERDVGHPSLSEGERNEGATWLR